MIRTESEYAIAVARLAAESTRLTVQRAQLKKSGLKRDEIKRVTDPMKSIERAMKVLDALGVRIHSSIEINASKRRASA